MSEMGMVERVARALYAIRMETADGAGLHEPYVWETDNNAYREHCLREARAAIEAMREPTEAMVEAGVSAETGKTLGDRVSNCYAAMIDAALTTSPST
jgi:hypothetical protein